MANYYMLGGDGKEYGPISAEQLRHWAAEGRANNYTQVRPAEDGSSWVAFGAVMELVAPTTHYAASAVHANLLPLAAKIGGSGAGAPDEVVKRLASTLAVSGGWMKFLALLMFLNAAATTLVTFGIGLIVAWIPFWLGLLLWTSANRARSAVASGSERDLQDSLDRLRFYFKLSAILLIIALIVGFGMALLTAAMPSLFPSLLPSGSELTLVH